MGDRIKWFAILLMLTAMAPFAEAQMLPLRMPWDLKVDSSVRLEYLFGRQVLKDTNRPESDLFRLDYGPQAALIEGMVEVSPPNLPLAARLGGALSFLAPILVLDSSVGFFRSIPFSLPDTSWHIRPDVKCWEAAALYHVAGGNGQRFSITAGYRGEVWRYRGELSSSSNISSVTEFASSIPFIGLQSAMFFPWWKARFEVLGFPFVIQEISHHLSLGGDSVGYVGRAKGTGFVELRMEGTVHVSPACWLGLFLRYSYLDAYGRATGSTTLGSLTGFSRDFYVGQSFATVGLNGVVLF